MTCENARLLIPGYLDGELSEEQAASLRQHLLDCLGCRETVKEGKTFKRWYVADPPPAIPSGFAARVARRAFAGDLGLVLDPAPSDARVEAAILPFVLKVTAAAAAILLGLSVGIRMQTLPPASEGLRADSMEVWDEIYDLDRPAADEEPEEDPKDQGVPR